jgi:hypothetical protein
MSGICRKCVVYRQNKQSHLYLPSSRFLSMKWNQSTHTDVINLYMNLYIYIHYIILRILHPQHSQLQAMWSRTAKIFFSSTSSLAVPLCCSCAIPLRGCCTASCDGSAGASLCWLEVGGVRRGDEAGNMVDLWDTNEDFIMKNWDYHGIIMGISWECSG